MINLPPPTPFELLEGKNCTIEDSYTARNHNSLYLGKQICNWSAQIVYRSNVGCRDVVVKILRESQQKKIITFEDEGFNEVEFYSGCLQAIADSGVCMPDYWDVVSLKIDTKTHVMAHIQSRIIEDFCDDTKAIELPDLGLIAGGEAQGKMRTTGHKEGYHIIGTDKVIYGDWKGYLRQLALIAKKLKITTKEEFQYFKKTIISSM